MNKLEQFKIEELYNHICSSWISTIEKIVKDNNIGPKSWKKLFNVLYEVAATFPEVTDWIDQHLSVRAFSHLDKELSWTLVKTSLEVYLNDNFFDDTEINKMVAEFVALRNQFDKQYNATAKKYSTLDVQEDPVCMSVAFELDGDRILLDDEDLYNIQKMGFRKWRK